MPCLATGPDCDFKSRTTCQTFASLGSRKMVQKNVSALKYFRIFQRAKYYRNPGVKRKSKAQSLVLDEWE